MVSADSCPTPPLQPAYAHNDYANKRPLHDALEAGLRGVEVDLYRRGAELLVGHARHDTESGANLRTLYLDPLAARVARCGPVLRDGSPFLLTLELKERDPAAFRLLVALLSEYRDALLTPGRIRPVLVGWWPPATDSTVWPAGLGVQLVWETRHTAASAGEPPIGMVSLDYSRTLRWNGRGTPPARATAVLAEARALADRLGVPLRVHQIPVRASAHRWLLADGVDLLGIKQVTDLRLEPPR